MLPSLIEVVIIIIIFSTDLLLKFPPKGIILHRYGLIFCSLSFVCKSINEAVFGKSYFQSDVSVFPTSVLEKDLGVVAEIMIIIDLYLPPVKIGCCGEIPATDMVSVYVYLFAFGCGIISGPVSYTHLDVYKRQILDFSIYDAVRVGFNKIVFVISRHFEQEFKKLGSGKYEHVVDVYKRQPFILLSGKLTEKVNNLLLLQIGLAIFGVSGCLLYTSRCV